MSGNTSQTVNQGTSGTTVTAVPNANYHFTGWSDGVTTASRTDTNVTADLNVTENFAINSYTVSFDSDGGSAVSDQLANYNGTAVKPAAAVRLEQPTAAGAAASLDGYQDIGNMSASDLENIRLLVKLRIMTGTSDHVFSPDGVTTRAQAATVFVRMLRQLELID
ncbi:hypothetical protein E6C55_04355 [Cohnella fermenti]|uniref:SLH domain-containing protein n=1 Tax=Cohnella fermenti TaxID=2565925 RepID=A0A4S4C696_9BACL|nr:hypothetical protein E6C55_04355 [Cohnella fermenti]